MCYCIVKGLHVPAKLISSITLLLVLTTYHLKSNHLSLQLQVSVSNLVCIKIQYKYIVLQFLVVTCTSILEAHLPNSENYIHFFTRFIFTSLQQWNIINRNTLHDCGPTGTHNTCVLILGSVKLSHSSFTSKLLMLPIY